MPLKNLAGQTNHTRLWNAFGESSSGGFTLTIKDPYTDFKATFTSKHHKNEYIGPSFDRLLDVLLVLLSPIAIACIFTGHLIIFGKGFMEAAIYLSLAAVAVIIPAGVFVLLSCQSETREWHSLEHKIIWILRMGSLPSVQSVRDTNSVSTKCGSVYLVASFSAILGVCIALYGHSGPLSGSAKAVLISAGIIFFASSYGTMEFWLKDARNSIRVPGSFLELLAFPVLKASMAIQSCCALKEPSQAKIEAVLAEFNPWYLEQIIASMRHYVQTLSSDERKKFLEYIESEFAK